MTRASTAALKGRLGEAPRRVTARAPAAMARMMDASRQSQAVRAATRYPAQAAPAAEVSITSTRTASNVVLPSVVTSTAEGKPCREGGHIDRHASHHDHSPSAGGEVRNFNSTVHEPFFSRGVNVDWRTTRFTGRVVTSAADARSPEMGSHRTSLRQMN